MHSVFKFHNYERIIQSEISLDLYVIMRSSFSSAKVRGSPLGEVGLSLTVED